MAKNQKRETQAVQFRTYGLFIVSVGLIAVMVMGFVLQRRTHQRLGAQVREHEIHIQELRRQTNGLWSAYARMSSPAELRRRAPGLGLSNITAGQRLYLSLPSAPPASQATNPVFAPPGTAVTRLATLIR